MFSRVENRMVIRINYDIKGMICEIKNLIHTINMYANLLNFFLAIAHQPRNIKDRKTQLTKLLERV
jgi:hypothetical protein